jgi:hypothetical protein
VSDETEIPPPDHLPEPVEAENWEPKLNPSQKKVFNSTNKFVLAYGEKGTGKSIGGLHALIRHCYEEDEALALLIAVQIRTGKEGSLYDLEWCLDIWKNGNWSDREQTTRSDEGMGLEYTEPALDPNTKDRVVYIGNRHGGWSKVILMSIPYAEVVAKRMKNLAPSFIYMEEITDMEGKEYFTHANAQLGRRRRIAGPQQFYASCNPEGPSHWVYQVFWIDCVNIETGDRDPEYFVIHVPIHENIHNLPPDYIKRLETVYKDPIERDRLLKGKWVDRPSGDAIFKTFFRPQIHVRGQFGLKPIKGFPIITGWDPGPVNYSIHFEQMVPCKDKVIWLTFEELNFVGEFTPDHVVVPRMLARMDYWISQLGSDTQFVHIADEAAFTHRRQDGSYDATRVQQLSGNRIRLRGCPKGKESVPSRVNMAITMLLAETAYIGTNCPKTIEMFKMLASEPAKEGKYDANVGLRPKRSPYIHPFDSWSYPPYYFTLHPAVHSLSGSHASGGAAVYRAGGG